MCFVIPAYHTHILKKIKLTILDWLFATICMATGMWIVFSATSVYGAGVSSDSVFYISSADNIVKGQGVFDYKKRMCSGLVVHLIKNQPEPGMMLYSNEPEFLYFLFRRPVKLSPMDPDHYAADRKTLLPRYSAWWPPEEQAYLIWFKPNIKRQYFPPDELDQMIHMEKIYKSWCGEMYRIRPKR